MWYLIVSIPDLCTLTYFESGNPDERPENALGTLYRTRCVNSIKIFRIGPVTLVSEHIEVTKTVHFVPSSTATTRDDCTEISYRSEVSGIGQSQSDSYWPSYRSEVSCIGPTRSDFVLAQLQVRGQLHWPKPNAFVLAQLQVRGQRLWPDLKCFHIGPVTGTRSAA